MSEFVVYEDTPFAEYLNSIESSESTVKLTPLDFHGTHNTASYPSRLKDKLSLVHLYQLFHKYWRGSMVHDTFSVSLPLIEETAFEEQFKYMIVTSPLLSETLSVHHPNKSKQRHAVQHMTSDYFTPTSKVSPAGSIGTVGTLSGLFALLGAETFAVYQKQQQTTPNILRLLSTPLIPITLLFTGSLSAFFVYRHRRRSGIRQLYHTTLTTLQSLMEQCESFDSKVHRTLITIQEIELVSRGYRLSTPLSPISRIEQTGKTRRCGTLRNRLANVLRRAFISYEEAIIDLVAHVNKKNLSRLYNMYNVHSVASLSAVDRAEGELDETSGPSIERLRTLAQLMHAKRRECMVQFLSLDLMSEGHDSVRGDYENGWRLVNATLEKVARETKGFVHDIIDALDTDQFKPSNAREGEITSLPHGVTDSRLKHFVHRLSSLDQQLRTVEAKFYLCNDDIKKLAAEAEDTNDDDIRARLKREYMSIQNDFGQMIVEWEAGRDALMTFLEPPELVPSPSSSAPTPNSPQSGTDLPSPVPSPSMEGQRVFDSEDCNAFDLPAPSRPSIYEAFAADEPIPKRSLKTRAERIAEMKAKREEQVRARAEKVDPQIMVHELKNVLGRRVTELGLEPEDRDASVQDG